MADLSWQPLRSLRLQFESNIAAMAIRHPELAAQLATLLPGSEYHIAADDSKLYIARMIDGQPQLLPNRLTAANAVAIAGKLYPTGKCIEPMLVAGLDQGWLWTHLFELPCQVAAFPGYTPPLYFLCPDIESLWRVLHLHDWRALLTDARVRLFCGVDCVDQAQRSMAANLNVSIPRLSVTVDEATWRDGATLDTINTFALSAVASRIKELGSQLDRTYPNVDAAALLNRFTTDRPLRIMGITSRFTTFLQYSMRDWLGAFEALGHETRLLIEPEDCALFNQIVFSEACAEFRPDMIVMIDRYRGEFTGMPANIPWVMWVQDQLPHIFCDAAGAAQKQFDYAIGYGRCDCVYGHGYPSDRFMPAMVGTNEHRFIPRRLTEAEYNRFACDVSFVSHCSIPAEELLRQETQRHNTPAAKRVLETAFEKLRARYDAGESVTMPHEFQSILDSTMKDLNLSTGSPAALLNIFTHKINNALFRHQALGWLTEMDDVRLHLYGRGWEQHPKFARYARGIADNQDELSAIYQLSKINLQVTPFGAAHQRVFDGLAAGGFFLMRSCEGDLADRIYRELWEWCDANGVRTDAQLRAAQAHPQVREWIGSLTRINGRSPLDCDYDFVAENAITASAGFDRNASTLWDEYDQVVFRSRDELHARVRHYLNDDADRAQITRSMRQRVLDRMTYRRVAERTVNFVRDHLRQQTMNPPARIVQGLAA